MHTVPGHARVTHRPGGCCGSRLRIAAFAWVADVAAEGVSITAQVLHKTCASSADEFHNGGRYISQNLPTHPGPILAKKDPKERVQIQAPTRHVRDWKAEAELLEIKLSEFIRRACRAYSKRMKKKRGENTAE
jgi:hypothetical protein